MPSPVLLLRDQGGGSPNAPVVSVTVVSSSQISVSWTAQPNASSYQIYRSVSGGGYSLLQSGIPAGTLNYVDSGLTASTAYCYELRAVNTSGSSPDSAPACGTTSASAPPPPSPPDPPVSVSAIATSSTQIQVSWSAVAAAEYYVVYRSTSGGSFVLDTPFGVPSGQTSYVKGGLAASTNYCFKVHAANSVGESIDSPTACATTPALLLGPSPTYSHWTYLAGSYRSMTQRMVPNNDPAPHSGQTSNFGFFYALTFGFSGGNGGYVGMQTDMNGKRYIASIWGATGAWGVYPGAVASTFTEDGDGWRISLPKDWAPSTDPQYVYETEFQMIESSTPHYWDIWFQENITGALTASTRFQLGYFRVPSTWGRINTNVDNFVEYYAPPPGCAAVPYSSVTFHAPILNFDDPNFRPDRQYGHWHGLNIEANSPCYADIFINDSTTHGETPPPRVDETVTHVMGQA